MHQLIEVLISGIILGSVYSVVSIGLSLVYGTSKVFNFAYGSFFTLGAYIAWILAVYMSHLSYPFIFILTAFVMFIVGIVFERIIIRPLRWRSEWQITTMIATLGLALLLDNIALLSFGPLVKVLPPLFNGEINIGGFIIRKHGIAMLIIAIIIMIAIELFLTKSRLGKAMRAVSENMVGAKIVGINVNRIFGYTFGLSTVMAGVSGILLAPIYLIYPLGGWEPFMKAFVIVVFGGLGSFKGTLYSALILGIVEAFVSWLFGASWVMSFWFLSLIIILVVRPKGLLGSWN